MMWLWDTVVGQGASIAPIMAAEHAADMLLVFCA